MFGEMALSQGPWTEAKKKGGKKGKEVKFKANKKDSINLQNYNFTLILVCLSLSNLYSFCACHVIFNF